MVISNQITSIAFWAGRLNSRFNSNLVQVRPPINAGLLKDTGVLKCYNVFQVAVVN